CRTDPDQVLAVRAVLAATANPDAPLEVRVSRPSDALAAQQASDHAFTELLLALGAVALLVGGVGVANTMVISVIERRSEIALRAPPGAARGPWRGRFLAESRLRARLGGTGGVVIGIAVPAGYASTRDWPVVVPAAVSGGGLVAAAVIGGLAGLYPALRAA